MSHALTDSPIGKLLLVTGDAGLTRIALPNQTSEPVLASLDAATDHDSDRADKILTLALRELDKYFVGKLTVFTVAVDLSRVPKFRARALQTIAAIPYGDTMSYGEVALETGNPKAVRAVGTACATNPVPLVVPCHRVTKSGGLIGNYGGGPEMKRFLLDLESPRG